MYRVPSRSGEPGESGETGKWRPGLEKVGNNVKITQNQEKGINFRSIKREPAPNDKTKTTGEFPMTDVLFNLIG